MIKPQEIRAKAERLYPKAIAAWLMGDAGFFPYRIRANLDLSDDHAEAIRQFDALIGSSKQKTGSGYRVESAQKKQRRHGENLDPTALWIDSMDDLVRLVGKLREFRRLGACIEELHTRLPQLSEWAVKNWKRVIAVEQSLSDMILVAEYMREHPRPYCYLRELPLAISTKLIEENKPLLTEWFNQVLPTGAINYQCDPKDFELRFGFRKANDHFPVRLLDDSLMKALQCPYSELSLPREAIDALDVQNCTLVLVENLVSLWTVPRFPRGIALGGLGDGIVNLYDVQWFERVPIIYWGDLDVEGLNILARVRQRFPHVRSLMMDLQTHDRFLKERISGNQQPESCQPEAGLNADEINAFVVCRDENYRLEQERIPQSVVVEAFARLVSQSVL